VFAAGHKVFGSDLPDTSGSLTRAGGDERVSTTMTDWKMESRASSRGPETAFFEVSTWVPKRILWHRPERVKTIVTIQAFAGGCDAPL
jgi:hypothetical protein